MYSEQTVPASSSSEARGGPSSTALYSGRLAVVLPAYNEQGVIGSTITDVMAKLPLLAANFVVIPVDDGSQDDTGRILDQLAERYGGSVSVVHNTVNQGYGGALLAGFDRALAERADCIFFMDSDGQFDISELERFLPLIGSYDAVLGYRLDRQDHSVRKLNAWAWKALVSRMFRFRVRDIDCAFKLFRADFIRDANLRARGAMISTELLARLSKAHLRFVEVGVHHYPRTSGKSTGANPAVIARAFRELLALRGALLEQTGGGATATATNTSRAQPQRVSPQGEISRAQHTTDGSPLPRSLQRLRQALRAPLPSWVAPITIASFVVLSLLIHLQAAMTSLGAAYDILSYRMQAAAILHHQNVYVVTDRYPYPPVWIWIVGAAQWLSTALDRRFDVLVKVPGILGDLGIVVIIYRYLRDRIGPCLESLLIPALYAFNPVPIIIAAGHGQFDALVIFFVLLALQLRGVEQDRYPLWSALALGVAIALKGYPVLILPYFVLTAPRGKRLSSALAAFAPLVVACLVYIAFFGYSPQMVKNVVAYNSWPDFGWSALLLRTRWKALATGGGMALATSISHVLIVLFALVIPVWRYRTRPATAVAITFLAFLALTMTMSIQYVIWALPFVVVDMPISSIVFSAAAWVGAASLYDISYPSAVPHVFFWQWLASPLASYRRDGIAAILLVSGALVVIQLIRSLMRGGGADDNGALPLGIPEPAQGAYVTGARQAY